MTTPPRKPTAKKADTRAPRSPLGLADLARILSSEPDDADEAAARGRIACLGFALKETAQPEPGKAAGSPAPDSAAASIGFVPVDGETLAPPAPLASAAHDTADPDATWQELADASAVCDAMREEQTEPMRPVPADSEPTSAHLPAGLSFLEESELAPISARPEWEFSPIIAWARLWPAIKHWLSSSAHGKPDIPRLIEMIGNGIAVQTLPRLPRRDWAADAWLVFDINQRTSLFYEDCLWLYRHIATQRGALGLAVWTLEDDPFSSWQVWGGTARASAGGPGTAGGLPIPPKDAPLLIVSDLGMFKPGDGKIKAAWLRYAACLAQQGKKACVLVPISASLIDAELASAFEIVRWSEDVRLSGLSGLARPPSQARAEARQTDPGALDDMLALLSTTVRIEPALLRAVRRRLSRARFDSGLEAQCWNHLAINASVHVCCMQAEQVDAWRLGFSTVDTVRQNELKRLVSHYHRHLSPSINHEEILIWNCHARPDEELDAWAGAQALVAEAELFMRRFAKTAVHVGGEKPQWLAYGKRQLGRSDGMMLKAYLHLRFLQAGEASDTLTWLHLSDIHFSPTDNWQDGDTARAALLEFLAKQIAERNVKIDLIFCTGDIAFGASNAAALGAQYAMARKFFDQLLAICCCDISRLFVVPGNHDVVELAAQASSRRWGNTVQLEDIIMMNKIHTGFAASDRDTMVAMRRLGAWGAFVADYLPHQQAAMPGHHHYARILDIKGRKIGIAGFNSAWTCADDHNDRRLWLAAAPQFAHMHNALQGCALRIGLIHHPWDCFNDAERDMVKQGIGDEVQFCLHGHSHGARVEALSSHVTLAAGALGVGGDAEFGCNLVQLDFPSGAGQAYQYRYQQRRACWITADDVGAGGVLRFPLPLAQNERQSWALAWGRDDQGVYALAPNPWAEPQRVDYPRPDQTVPQVLWQMPASKDDDGLRIVELTLELDDTGLLARLSLHGGHGQTFRYIAAGRFMMGSATNEKGRYANEGPQHMVTISQGFWLADSVCTMGFWRALMGAQPSIFGGDSPVGNVSWRMAQQFLQKLQGLLPLCRATLPTEAEWEYACRAGTSTPFSFGTTITRTQVNYSGDAYSSGKQAELRGCTAVVKGLSPNRWGLYQMHGNVWEWCADGQRQYTGEVVADPGLDQALEPLLGSDVARVLRGGGWFDGARDVRSAFRDRAMPVWCARYTCFRLALRSKSTGKS